MKQHGRGAHLGLDAAERDGDDDPPCYWGEVDGDEQVIVIENDEHARGST